MSAPDPAQVEIAPAPLIARAALAPFRDRDAIDELLAGRFGLRLPPPGRFWERGGIALIWADSRSWWIEDTSRVAGRSHPLINDIAQLCRGCASVIDRSHGLRAIRIRGNAAVGVLAKGCALDLHPRLFEVGHCAATTIAHVAVHLRRLGPEDYLLVVPRSYAEHMLEWAGRAARWIGRADRG